MGFPLSFGAVPPSYKDDGFTALHPFLHHQKDCKLIEYFYMD